MAATRPAERLVRRTVAALIVSAGALCAPAPAAAADPLARVSIRIDGAIPQEQRAARMVVRDGGRTAYRGRIAIERRGQSTQRFPKQSWGLELRDRTGADRDVGLLGMPADDDWILYAAYNDKTLMRNVLAYATARRLGRYAARTRFVEVRLNGRRHGVYVLMEKLELQRDRLDLPEPAHLMEWTFSYQARKKGRYFRLPVSEYFLLFEDPDRADLGKRRRAQVRGSLGAAERALYGPRFRHPERGWRRHIHEQAAVDYVLVNELFKNQDAFHASTYLARGAGGRWALGPVWDFDIAMGNSDYGPSSTLTGSMLEDRAWASRLYRDPAFVAAVVARWEGLRADGLRRDLLRSVAGHARRLTATGAAARNFARWPVLGVRVWPNPPAAVHRTTYASEVAALRRWLGARIEWMDDHVRELG